MQHFGFLNSDRKGKILTKICKQISQPISDLLKKREIIKNFLICKRFIKAWQKIKQKKEKQFETFFLKSVIL